MFDLILFDFDNTLIDFERGQKIAIEKVCEEIGESFSLELLDEFSAIDQRLWKDFELGKLSKEEVQKRRACRSMNSPFSGATCQPTQPQRSSIKQ